jgi:hypothetical protein
MKADFSNWAHKPENPVILKAYAEVAILEGVTRGIIPSVVWRDGEFTLTLTPQEGEQTYDMGIVDSRPVEVVDLGFEPIPDEEEEEVEE